MVLPLPRRRRGLVVGLVFIALGLAVLASLLLSERAEAASEPVRDFSPPPPALLPFGDPSLASKIDEALVWLVTKKCENVDNCPAHPILSDPDFRKQIREAAISSGERYNQPPGLLLAMAYRETVFRLDLVGKKGELGLMQVGKRGREICASACGTMKTADEQMACGACWLDAGVRWCGGDLLRGLKAYAGGRCEAKTQATLRAVNWRYRVWRKIHSLVYGGNIS
jgi:hypothetical protein